MPSKSKSRKSKKNKQAPVTPVPSGKCQKPPTFVPAKSAGPKKILQMYKLQEQIIKDEEMLENDHDLKMEESDGLTDLLAKAWQLFKEAKAEVMYEHDFDGKNAIHAEQYRKEGNILYNKGEYAQAAGHYKMALVTATNEQHHTVVYINLSAVYFELHQYHKCLATVRHVLNNCSPKDYPQEYCAILKEREENCIAAMNAPPGSRSPKPSQIDMRAHCPVVDSRLRVETETLSGRGIVAGSDISAGSIVLSEQAFVVDLTFRNLLSNCYYCLESVVTPVGCRKCRTISYCSKDCEEKSWNEGAHEAECENFYSILLSKNYTALALKAVVKGARQHSMFFRKLPYERKYTARVEQLVEKYCKTELYASTDPKVLYPYVLNLHADFKHFLRADFQRFKDDMVYSVIFADFLINSHSKIFKELDKSQIDPTFLSYILFLHCCQFKYNSVVLQDVQYDANYEITNFKEYAVGIYPNVAMTNHSCAPNCAPVFRGDKAYFFTTRGLPKGAQMFNNYGPIYTVENRDERRLILQQRYGFLCFCDACHQNYAKIEDNLIEKNQKTHYLRCLSCDHCAESHCSGTCSNCQATIDVPLAIKNITLGYKARLSWKSFMVTKDYAGGVKQAEKSCTLLEKAIGVPDYDVASLYFKFATSYECLLKHNIY